MKQTLFILITLICLSSCASIGKLGKSGSIQDGTVLYYEVNGETPYDVYINHFSKDSIEFKYQSDHPDGWGIIQMNDWALKFGQNLKNYFPEWGETLNLVEETAVWMSHKNFRDVKEGKEIGMGTGFANTWTLRGPETYSFTAKDGMQYDLPVIVITDATESQEIWINDDENNPLILMMIVDFRIELVDVKL